MKFKKYIALSLVSLTLFSSCSLKGKHHDIKDYMHTLEWKENYKILQLTDLHFSSYDDLNEDFKFLDLVLEKANNPDLVIVSGDLFTFTSKSTINAVLNHFDSWGIKWTLVYGNHDEQIYADYTYTSKYAAKLKNSVFNFYNDDLTGLSNNIINLKDGDVTKFQIFALDSNTYTYKKGIGYDYVHQDQIDWYKEAIETVNKERFGNTWTKDSSDKIKSIIFQHIPVPEVAELVEEYRNGNTSFGTGLANEPSCPPKYNSGFFDVIKDYGSTKAMFYGHDHINTLKVTKDGFDFVYGVKSTDNMYHDEDILGGRIITISDENTILTEEIRATYTEVK